ncbi:AAA family ATPase [uncultured Actinomyces sp.]|uniref:AAA family ATPase n=1 Tax=uncultured Actinomyces sp. TaxID=249061 RepID=UPI0028E6F11F|nr:AAA family ATPase [uncultured Actinomyces sp.]
MSTATEWPRAEVSLSSEGHARVNLGGVEMDLSQPSPQEARAAVVAHLSRNAKALGHPISTVITDPVGSWRVAVHPDGTVITEGAPTSPAPQRHSATRQARTRSAPEPQRPSASRSTSRLPAVHDSAPQPPTRRRLRREAPVPGSFTPETAGHGLPPQVPPRATDTASFRAVPRADPRPERTRPAPSPTSPPTALSASPPASSSPPAPASPPTASPASAPMTMPAPAPPAEPVPSSTPPEYDPPKYDPREQARSTSLLTEITNEAPATTGLRGVLNQLGLHLAPAARERAERADVAAVAQHWAGPRTIAVVNGKGGAGKTPTAILLAAVFARYGGAGVVAYDNNSTRGTLGWRTQQGPHDATVIDLLPHIDHLLSPQAQAAEISGFVHHQREDRYDVLRSRPEVLADAQADAGADSFDAVHSVLTKYYRLVVVDSGNDESSPQWRAMIACADAIVVPTITRPDHAESARLLLAELAGADAHAARLAENALVVVSQDSKAEPPPTRLVSTFTEIARAAVGIPYDSAMAGRPLILDSLTLSTRRAWLSAGTALAAGL